jgi:hypothetical protein
MTPRSRRKLALRLVGATRLSERVDLLCASGKNILRGHHPMRRAPGDPVPRVLSDLPEAQVGFLHQLMQRVVERRRGRRAQGRGQGPVDLHPVQMLCCRSACATPHGSPRPSRSRTVELPLRHGAGPVGVGVEPYDAEVLTLLESCARLDRFVPAQRQRVDVRSRVHAAMRRAKMSMGWGTATDQAADEGAWAASPSTENQRWGIIRWRIRPRTTIRSSWWRGSV